MAYVKSDKRQPGAVVLGNTLGWADCACGAAMVHVWFLVFVASICRKLGLELQDVGYLGLPVPVAVH